MIRATAALVAAFVCSSASAQDVYGYFCTAEGTGIWGGVEQTLRWQTSRVPTTPGVADPEVILYANEETAAVFTLKYVSRNHWEGVSNVNPNVRVDMYATEGGTAVFRLNDWRNVNTTSYGSCDTAAYSGG